MIAAFMFQFFNPLMNFMDPEMPKLISPLWLEKEKDRQELMKLVFRNKLQTGPSILFLDLFFSVFKPNSIYHTRYSQQINTSQVFPTEAEQQEHPIKKDDKEATVVIHSQSNAMHPYCRTSAVLIQTTGSESLLY